MSDMGETFQDEYSAFRNATNKAVKTIKQVFREERRQKTFESSCATGIDIRHHKTVLYRRAI